ncbi:uncharacterized protein V1518DRAFT_418774 [Limtongia smithiae]|uniref:uncharacterized protein n=1 Tax=Limtongia smithiae TaxID=1125753 RepID=UPI0034CD7672
MVLPAGSPDTSRSADYPASDLPGSSAYTLPASSSSASASADFPSASQPIHIPSIAIATLAAPATAVAAADALSAPPAPAQGLFCPQCHLLRPAADFRGPASRPEIPRKYCIGCRRKMSEQKGLASRPNRAASRQKEFPDIDNFRKFTSIDAFKEMFRADLFTVPVKFTGPEDPPPTPPVHQQQQQQQQQQHPIKYKNYAGEARALFKYLILPDTPFGTSTVGTLFSDSTQEPTEVYKFIVKALMEVTGYSFQRHGRYAFTRNTGGWSSRYKCGQGAHNASRSARVARNAAANGTKGRNVEPRAYFKCDSNLSISGSAAGIRVLYSHLHIHPGRTRNPSQKKGDPIFPTDIPTNIALMRERVGTFETQLRKMNCYPTIPPNGFTGFDNPHFAERQRLMSLFFATDMLKNNRPLQDYLIEKTNDMAAVLNAIHAPAPPPPPLEDSADNSEDDDDDAQLLQPQLQSLPLSPQHELVNVIHVNPVVSSAIMGVPHFFQGLDQL